MKEFEVEIVETSARESLLKRKIKKKRVRSPERLTKIARLF